jgi:hypothetical protein
VAAERINISAAPKPLLDSILEAGIMVNACEAEERQAAKDSQDAMDIYVRRVLQAMKEVGDTESAGKIEKFLAAELMGGFELALSSADWVVEFEFKEKEA